MESKKNNIFPITTKGSDVKLIEIPKGACEIDDIETFLKKAMNDKKNRVGPNNKYIAI